MSGATAEGAFCQVARRALLGSMKRTKKPPHLVEHVGLRMEPALRRALEQAAARERRPLAHMMRIALSDWLADRSQAGERASA